jgi:hypothetical protein
MFGLPNLNYHRQPNGTLTYRNTHDSDSYARGYLKMSYNKPWISNKKIIQSLGLDLDPDSHDHMPENDAELLYRLTVEINKRIK